MAERCAFPTCQATGAGELHELRENASVCSACVQRKFVACEECSPSGNPIIRPLLLEKFESEFDKYHDWELATQCGVIGCMSYFCTDHGTLCAECEQHTCAQCLETCDECMMPFCRECVSFHRHVQDSKQFI